MIRSVFVILACMSLQFHASEAGLVSLHSHKLVRRRMGQEHPKDMPKVDDCPGEICGTIFGKIPGALLAGADACAAQDVADLLVDQAKTNSKLSDTTKKQLIEFAKALCAAEKNTHPDYQKNSAPRNALYCQKEPKNSELAGIVRKQDSANNPTDFFDPATKSTVLLDKHPGTRPLGSKGGQGKTPSRGSAQKKEDEKKEDPKKEDEKKEEPKKEDPKKEDPKKEDPKKEDPKKEDPKKEDPKKEEEKKGGSDGTVEPSNLKVDAPDSKAGGVEQKENSSNADKKTGGEVEKKDAPGGDIKSLKIGSIPNREALSVLGKCSNPEIQFAPGLEGRPQKDVTFAPMDKTNFPQSSALNLAIITNAMCDKFLNCGFKNEDQFIKDCRELGKSIGKSAGDGAGADKWNKAVRKFNLRPMS